MSEGDVLEALALLLSDRLGLGGDATATVGWNQLPARDFVLLAARHRVAGLLGGSQFFGMLPGQVRQDIDHLQRRQLFLTMRQGAEQAQLLSDLGESGIRVLVMKGQPFSQTVYGDWAERGPGADVDLLVSPEDLIQAHAFLKRQGYWCSNDAGRQAPLTGWRGRYNGFLHYERAYRCRGRLNVDLHWRPVVGGDRWADFEEIWRRRLELQTPSGPVATLGRTASLIVAVDQGASDGWPDLRSCSDVVAASAICSPGERAQALDNDCRVGPGTRHAEHLLAHPSQLKDRQNSAWATSRRQYAARRAGSTVAKATFRSAFGKFLPARKLVRKPGTSGEGVPVA